MRRTLSAIAGATALLAWPVYAVTVDYTFTRVAGDGFSPSISEGNVAFIPFGHAGVSKWINGTLLTVADDNTIMPGQNFRFDGFDRPIIDGKDVAFEGSGFDASGQEFYGIYKESGGVLTKIVDHDTVRPGSSATFGLPRLIAFDNGEVVFSSGGLFRSDGNNIDTIFTDTPGQPLIFPEGMVNVFGLGAVASENNRTGMIVLGEVTPHGGSPVFGEMLFVEYLGTLNLWTRPDEPPDIRRRTFLILTAWSSLSMRIVALV